MMPVKWLLMLFVLISALTVCKPQLSPFDTNSTVKEEIFIKNLILQVS